VAVLLVLYGHAQYTAGFPREVLGRLTWCGRVGVDIFFVLSGFLITTLLLREIERTGRVQIRAFFLRRFLRIVPAYVAYLGAIALLQTGGWVEVTGREWLALGTYTVNFLPQAPWEIGHIWSLSVEEHFYLAWPVVMAAGVTLGRRAALGCLACCFTLRWLLLLAAPDLVLLGNCTFTRMDTIAMGCLLAMTAREPGGRALLNRLTGRLWPLLVLAALPEAIHRYYSETVWLGAGFTIQAASLALVLWWAVRQEHAWPGRLLNSSLMQAVGVGSYSIYLWQQPFLARGHEPNLFITFPQNLLFALGAAILSYQLVEKPFLNLKARLGEPAAEPGPIATTAPAVDRRRGRRTAVAPVPVG
jgi:peptidoglycan/LPS O-acetylase OafA/YrhL